MKLSKLVRGSIACLTCCGMLSAQLAQAAGTSTAPPLRATMPAPSAIRDVALEEQGVLRGQVVDAQGTPGSNMPVTIVRQGQEVTRTETGPDGRFAVRGLTGGVYHVSTPVGTSVYRVWSPHTAPPAAAQEALVVADESVVRSQMGGSALSWLANPWVLAAIVAAAIAIPLALDRDEGS